MIKVLMFGWEFPPHISGGLGTACLGLTQSLSKENVQILFVVPKTDDHTPFKGVNVMGASNVPIPLSDIEIESETWVVSHIDKSIEEKTGQQKLIQVLVRSELLPYFSEDTSFEKANISQWNYQLHTGLKEQKVKVKSKRKESVNVQYAFSGGYGPRLLQEVERYAIVAKQIAIRNSFDIIHAHDWLTYPAAIEAKNISGKPLVVHVHATEYDRSGENADQRVCTIERNGLEQADRIIAVSQLTKNIIVSRYNIPFSKVEVVHNGVTPRQSNIEATPSLHGKQVVTFLGRITQQKGPSYFVEAAHKVLTKFPDVHFVMAGSGDMLPKMVKLVATLRMSAHFHFTGFLTNSKVNQIWSMSDVYVMPSVSEPFGITPLEAMMAGVPVIISNQSGVAEVVQHAIKIDFWDTDALANAICNLLAHKSLINTIKTKSEIEIKKINWDKAAKRTKTLYNELTIQS